MPVLQEGQLRFSFPRGSSPVQFDDASHGLSHCMKAVDFIVEFRDFYLFVEVKDPDNTQATPARRQAFATQIGQPEFARIIARKYRDSFIYRWAQRRLDKPVRYVVMLQLSTLSPPDFLTLDQAFKREIPVCDTPPTWVRPLADGMAVLNIAQWNALGVYGSVERA